MSRDYYYASTTEEKFLERIAEALERIADHLDSQTPEARAAAREDRVYEASRAVVEAER